MRPSAWMMSAVLCGCFLSPPARGADERVEGIVRDTVVTHCDATRRGGCAGTLTLERQVNGMADMLRIRVPLGTPISRGVDHAILGSLKGETVIVTQSADRGGRIARAIQVAEPPKASTVPDSRFCDVC